MPRVIGIDPGTVSIDLCGLEDGHLFLDLSLPTAEACADPQSFVRLLRELGSIDLIAGPSGYGLPMVPSSALTEEALRLAFLGSPGEDGGIVGLRSLARALADSGLPVIFTPGVVQLDTVAEARKVNRIDMGTADKVCTAALAIHEQSTRRGCDPSDTVFVLLELGGAFTAGLAIDGGRIVDGAGGSSGAVGMRGAGALDGEVAFLAGAVPKEMLFRGGACSIAGDPLLDPERLASPRTSAEHLALAALLDSVTKLAGALLTVVSKPREIVLAGRLLRVPAFAAALVRCLAPLGTVSRLEGFAQECKEAAQGAALVADGLAGGSHRTVVDAMQLYKARGTVLDYLYVISREDARGTLGLDAS